MDRTPKKKAEAPARSNPSSAGTTGATNETQPLAGPGRVPVCLPEVRTPEAAKILGVSKDTVLKLREAGVLPFRNAAPPGSTRPVFRFPLDAVLKLRGGYHTEVPAPRGPKAPPRRRAAG